MRRAFWPGLLILALAASACSRPEAEVGAPTASPAASPGPGPAASGSVTASAMVVPARRAGIGFLMTAPVREVAVREGDRVVAGQTLMVLDAPQLEASVSAAQAGLRSAQAEARYWIYPRNEPPERKQVANAQLRVAEAALEAAQAELARATLVAPFDGTVVAVHVNAGELVQPGQVVLELGDLDHLQLETTDLGEANVASIQIGQPASVRFKSFDRELEGKVAAIAPLGEASGGDVLYKVTIALTDPPEGLEWGMSCDVVIRTAP